MSWIFGYGNKQPQIPNMDAGTGAPPGAGESAGDAQLSKAERKAMEAYRFDSTALERAASAARELERSGRIIDFVGKHDCYYITMLLRSWSKLHHCNRHIVNLRYARIAINMFIQNT